MDDLYKILGIQKDATIEEIKSSYRTLAKVYHPDKKGSAELFKKINLAYRVLSDSIKREKYDNTGSTDEVDFDIEFRKLIASLFMSIASKSNIKTEDLIKKTSNSLKSDIQKLREQIKKNKESMVKLTEIKNRVTIKNGEYNIITEMLENNIADGKLKNEGAKTQIKFLGKLIKRIRTYNYKVDKKDVVINQDYIRITMGNMDGTSTSGQL